MTLQEAYLFYSNKLKQIEINNPSNEARIIIKHSLDITDSTFLINPNMLLSDVQKDDLENLFNKRLTSVPLAYVLNSQFFWKHDFYVNENVLIPRGDSETLIVSFLKYFSDKNKDLNILEIGVGSGCLILSILDEYKNSRGLGVDISQEALNVCKINANRLELINHINLLQSDLFENVQEKFDVIISNPPYIDEHDVDLAEDVKQFEPHLALFAENNGLYFYEKILQQAKNYLHTGGMIFFEIGYTQNKAVIDLAKQNGFAHVETAKDLSAKDRVVILRIES